MDPVIKIVDSEKKPKALDMLETVVYTVKNETMHFCYSINGYYTRKIVDSLKLILTNLYSFINHYKIVIDGNLCILSDRCLLVVLSFIVILTIKTLQRHFALNKKIEQNRNYQS